MSRRAYKEGWTLDAALAEIKAKSGWAFDPELVDIFFRLAPEMYAEFFHGAESGPERPSPTERRTRDQALAGIPDDPFLIDPVIGAGTAIRPQAADSTGREPEDHRCGPLTARRATRWRPKVDPALAPTPPSSEHWVGCASMVMS